MAEKGTFKLAVVGGGGVGKSALTLQLVKQQFCEEYDPTIEDSHRKQVEIDGEVNMLEIFDTAGQEELSALRDQALRVAEGFLLVFAITEESSFKQVVDLHGSITRAKDSNNVPIVLVGNKSDLQDERTVEAETIEELYTRLNIPYFEASAKNCENVEESFFELVRIMRAARNTSKSGGTGAKSTSEKKKTAKGQGCGSLLRLSAIFQMPP